MFNVIPEYISWHYGRGLRDLKNLIGNFLSFIYHFFSIPVLLRTLFVPWRRMAENYKGGFSIGSFFETLILNIVVRLVGVLFRLIFIVIGILLVVAAFIIGIAFFLFWLTLPFFIIAAFIKGILLL